jgi:hypothetical protein
MCCGCLGRIDNSGITRWLTLPRFLPCKIAPVSHDTKGDTGGIIPETLRTATKPLSTEQVCQAVKAARRLDTNDKALCRT